MMKMCEKLFRGKRTDNGEWVEGYYCKYPHQFSGFLKDCIFTSWYDAKLVSSVESGTCIAYPVDPETVGQYTGLTDKNGTKIFEGDILKGFDYPYLDDKDFNYFAKVVWFDNCPAFGIYTFKNPQAKIRGISEGNTELMEEWNPSQWEVIGNIYDNPELLEGKNDT